MTERSEREQNSEPNRETETPKLENNIGSFSETINMGSVDKFPMSSDNVYRKVNGDNAVNDIFESGVVRNAKSVGLSGRGRENQVYWTRGEDNKEMGVGGNQRVIEASAKVAEERLVTKEDVTAIYELGKDNKVRDSLAEHKALIKIKQEESEQARAAEKQRRIEEDSQQIENIRSQLGITNPEYDD